MTSSFSPACSKPPTSQRHWRNMLSARPTDWPFSTTSASVSSPSHTSVMRSAASRSVGTAKVVRYSQSRSATQATCASLSPTKGSGICRAASRSVCTPSGTVASNQASAPTSRNCHRPDSEMICIGSSQVSKSMTVAEERRCGRGAGSVVARVHPSGRDESYRWREYRWAHQQAPAPLCHNDT